ncbi:MAG: hypothetical protein H6585_11805 [Flavobacteriales bacterium]|nr:hypothetical protein [Flavobacteriales bacterium]MCB9449014.1 hypothetical protein [Flavobacteriales bacterium]
MRITVIVFLFLLAVATGCSHRGIQLVPVKTIRTGEAGTPVFFSGAYSHLKEGEYWIYFDPDRDALRYIPLKGDSIADTPLDSLPVVDRTPEGLAFYVHNLDSIFAFPHHEKTVFLINRNGEIRNQWVIDRPLPSGETNYSVLSIWLAPMVYRNERFYMTGIRNSGSVRTPDGLSKTYDVSSDLSIDLTRTPYVIHNSTGMWPAIYRKNYWDDSVPQRCVDHRGNVIYNFSVTPQVDVYRNDSLVFSGQAKSRYLKKERQPYDLDSIGNFVYLKRYYVEQPIYKTIVEDPYRKLYYLPVILGGDYLDSDGLIRRSTDNPWSLIVMDTTFRVVDEVLMDPRRYGRMVVPTPEGVMLNTKDGTDSLTFTVFKLQMP